MKTYVMENLKICHICRVIVQVIDSHNQDVVGVPHMHTCSVESEIYRMLSTT
jgi:hypothetical protein